MPLYLIERDFTDSTQEELGAATIRAKMCTPWYEGMEWIRSYYESALERTLCIYRVASAVYSSITTSNRNRRLFVFPASKVQVPLSLRWIQLLRC